MTTAFEYDATRDILSRLAAHRPAAALPAPAERRPVHTVYGGAHLFRPDVARRLGGLALATLAEHAPDFASFARAAGLGGAERLPAVPAERERFEAWLAADEESVRGAEPQVHLAWSVHRRMRDKLEREPVEDYRIDFEDGYGERADTEEDAHAAACAEATAEGLAAGTLPPFLGIRIKPLHPATEARAVRTLGLYLATLLPLTKGALPRGFVVTLPKVGSPAETTALAELLAHAERIHGLAPGALRCEIMVETPQALLGADGRVPLRAIVAAAGGRCRGAHLGAYDVTAALDVAAPHQSLDHPAATFARRVLQFALAGTGVWLSDGAVTRLPVTPHRARAGAALTPAQLQANHDAVHGAWREHAGHVRRALHEGYDQGWDLHPGQLPSRHAAVIAYFLEGRAEAAARLALFVARAAQATRLGTTFDDAATGQGLLNFFLRGIACGAFGETEVTADTGLSPAELRERSFMKILENRRGGRA